jgi:alkyl hydroperoxide reductase subunit AhpC
VDGSDIRRIHLNEFKGKWLVLFFYPSDFTPV